MYSWFKVSVAGSNIFSAKAERGPSIKTYKCGGEKVLTGLRDSCHSQALFGNLCLQSLALTKVSFNDFPLRYDSMGGS